MRSTSVRALLVAVVALVLFGCSVEHQVTGPLPGQPQPPVADSPTNAIRLFEWGWDHRELGAFQDVLAGDFVFVFALGDSAGNAFRDRPLGREDLVGCLGFLFAGGGLAPPAVSVVLSLDPIGSYPDSRPGKDPTWHREIVTTVDLTIKLEDLTEHRIAGNARFFVVRGDSAVMPADPVARGAEPDSTRWYIDQWNDETLQGGGALLRAFPAMPQPESNPTWGQILALYYWGPRR